MGMDLVSHNKIKHWEPLDSDPEAFLAWYDKEFEMHNRERFSQTSWAQVLTLAKIGGWQPQGTQPGDPFFLEEEDRDPKEWDGNYWANYGQTVTAEDAAALAGALEKMLDDIPDRQTAEPMKTYRVGDLGGDEITRFMLQTVSDPGFEVYSPDPDISPIDFFSGPGKDHVRSFIVFCRKGAFSIW